MSSSRFQGRVIVVTGAGSGIGAATARRLAVEGGRVAVADIDEIRTKEVAAEIDGLAVHMDVTDSPSVRAGIEHTRDALGPIDVLVNNAGGDQLSLFVDTDEEMWDRTLALNLRSAIACTHAVLPEMHEQRRGAIVCVASEAGRTGVAAGACYSAAKAGVIGFTKSIARESARFGVRCNAVAPGPTDTPLLSRTGEAGVLGARMRDMMIGATVLGRAAQPEEVAAAIAFLASDDASFVTGETVAVSGGISMW
jgi:2-hydroxycyclohexanecarboxyl-CoA dehydrogenase